jgi:hypothetical protein
MIRYRIVEMDQLENIWNKLKNLPEKEWAKLKKRRDNLSKRTSSKLKWREIVKSFNQEEVEQMSDAIEKECERIDLNGW